MLYPIELWVRSPFSKYKSATARASVIFVVFICAALLIALPVVFWQRRVLRHVDPDLAR